MADIIIETDSEPGKLYEWLRDDPEARKVSVSLGDDDTERDFAEGDRIHSSVETSSGLWTLALTVKTFQRSRHASRRPSIRFEYRGRSVEVATANRDAVDDLFYAPEPEGQD